MGIHGGVGNDYRYDCYGRARWLRLAGKEIELKFVYDLLGELDKAWPGNEVRILDEKGIEYRLTLMEEEEDITYLKVQEL